MTALLWLLPLSMCFVVGAAWMFFWAVKNRQFQDLDREALQVLEDAPEPGSEEEERCKPC